MTLIFRPEAAKDLQDIARYSRLTFGKAQAKRYIRQIEACCLSLSPSRARQASRVSAGLWRRSVASHVVFFRMVGSDVVVVRILHEAMNFEDHL
jgi:toxin ParE1/3/4